ncbi:MAG: polyphenol oxidase family protein [Aquificae bacterium]|nr:polyphenol oxidase family protein [Aquificota bacterium]
MKNLKFGNLNIVYTERTDGNQKIEKNRELVLKTFGFKKVHIPNQKHTNKVSFYKNEDIESDGLYTTYPNTPIGVLTADCMPIALFDRNTLSVVHAGWKGLFSGIIQNSLKNLDIKQTKAFILPSIKQCCYQVDQPFIEKLNIPNKYLRKDKNGIYLNLQKVAKDIILRYGIKYVYHIPLCTKCCDKLYSYRKGDFAERILTFAWFE